MRTLVPHANLLLGLATLGFVFNASDMNWQNDHPGIDKSPAKQVSSRPANPLLEEWIGPYKSIPPFDRVVVADFKPALEAGIQESLTEINKITDDGSAPTFENTIAALWL